MTLRLVDEADWSAAWQEHFHVLHVGRRLVINRQDPIEVVGVVRDSRVVALADPGWPAVFLPLLQNFRGGVTLVVGVRLVAPGPDA